MCKEYKSSYEFAKDSLGWKVNKDNSKNLLEEILQDVRLKENIPSNQKSKTIDYEKITYPFIPKRP